MAVYTAVTFSPVQGFIEKSRKLRDLYGSSLILSHLSKKLVDAAMAQGCQIISPGLIKIDKQTDEEGMPNRILIEGDFSRDSGETALKSAWKAVLSECKEWVERNLPEKTPNTYYHWKREWGLWGENTWEIFWGQGESIQKAMDNLEAHKLPRNWTGVNWIGESSSITGTDAIAWNGLGKGTRNPKTQNWSAEEQQIDFFYRRLAFILDGENPDGQPPEREPEGKFLAANERLSIPELVKRLVTYHDIAKKLDIPELETSFTDFSQSREQWTGWFMGDGDKVGDHLKNLAKEENGDKKIKSFSDAMREWGQNFKNNFSKELGRIVYAGGDDFLGVIYHPEKEIKPSEAFEWLTTLPKEWEKHKQKPNLSLGFVWAASKVPQRDILQHCREAEKDAKNAGRNRVAIRIVFRSGQFLQWICPWDELGILSQYIDREEKTGKEANWNHIYSDLEQLKARHAFGDIGNDLKVPLALMDIYFDNQGNKISQNRKYFVGDSESKKLIDWIDNLIQVGWWLLRNQ